MSLSKVFRSLGIVTLLVGVALVASSCAAKQKPITEEKPAVEEPATTEAPPQAQPQPQAVVPPGPSEEMPPVEHQGKAGKKAKKHKTKHTTKLKGKKHGNDSEVAESGGGATLWAEMQSAGNFKTFSKIVKSAGLAKWMRSNGPFTVLAPTDAAFNKLPAGTVDGLVKSKNKNKLQNFVFAHTLKGNLSTAELKGTKSVQTWNGQTRKVHSEGDQVVVGKAHVAKREIHASNGVIHPVNTVFISAAGEPEHKSTNHKDTKSKKSASHNKPKATTTKKQNSDVKQE